MVCNGLAGCVVDCGASPSSFTGNTVSHNDEAGVLVCLPSGASYTL
jgi:hypothetical protein